MTEPHPSNITIDRPNNLLIIDWQDGAHCEYPLSGIRYVCPCAECRGGHEFMGQPIDPADIHLSPPPGISTEVANASIMGNYGINFVWADGHDDGIYTWALLRAFCPETDQSQAIPRQDR